MALVALGRRGDSRDDQRDASLTLRPFRLAIASPVQTRNLLGTRAG
jgi:hypothetical protein